MRGGSHHRNAEPEAGQSVAGSGTTAYESGPSAEHSRFRRMGAPGAEFDDIAAPGSMDDAGGFGRDQSFECDGREEIGLRDLALDQRGANVHHRLPGIEHGTLGDRENVSGETETGEIVPEARGSVAEVLEAAQIRDFVGLE